MRAYADSFRRDRRQDRCCGSIVDLFAERRLNHHTTVTGGVLGRSVRRIAVGLLRVPTMISASWRNHGVGLYAPAGFVTDPAAIERAIADFEAPAIGHRRSQSCKRRWQRFSPPRRERLAAVTRMAIDKRVESRSPFAVVTGGHACSTDFLRQSRRPRKRWLGHSDFTAFQLALLAKTGSVTFAGPMAAYDFGAENPGLLHLSTGGDCWTTPLRRSSASGRAVATYRDGREAMGRQPRDGGPSGRLAVYASNRGRYPVS